MCLICREGVTGIGGGDESGAGEVAVEGMKALGVVVRVHEEGGVSPDRVGCEARAAASNRVAVNSLAANVVYVAGKLRLRRL